MNIITLCLCLTLPVLADEPKPSAAAILDKAIEAHGGWKKLTGYKAHTWKAKGTMAMMGMKTAYDIDYLLAPGVGFRFDLLMDIGGQKMDITAATNGKAAWESSGKEIRDMEAQKGKEFIHNTYVMTVSQLYPLKEPGYTLEMLGESKHGEQTLIGIKVSHKDHRDVSLYFDKASYLLVKSSSRIVDEFTKKEVVQETVLSGPRKVDGLMMFDKLVILRDGKEMIVEEMRDHTLRDTVDAAKFEKPAGK